LGPYHPIELINCNKLPIIDSIEHSNLNFVSNVYPDKLSDINVVSNSFTDEHSNLHAIANADVLPDEYSDSIPDLDEYVYPLSDIHKHIYILVIPDKHPYDVSLSEPDCIIDVLSNEHADPNTFPDSDSSHPVSNSCFFSGDSIPWNSVLFNPEPPLHILVLPGHSGRPVDSAALLCDSRSWKLVRCKYQC
jgi:hypothetical protein